MRGARRQSAVELALLAGLAVAPFARPLGLAAAAAAVLAACWWWLADRPRREQWAGGIAFALAAALLIGAAGSTAWGGARTAGDVATAERSWWRTLAADAARAARALESAETAPLASAAPFAPLAALEPAAPGRSFLLLDPAGEPAAWAGAGLLHRLDAAGLPAEGFAFLQSATSASALAVAPLAGRPGWRAVAGESRPRSGAPPLAGAAARIWRESPWALEPADSPGGEPGLRLDGAPRPAAPVEPARLARWAAAAAGVGIFVLAVLRAVGLALLAGTVVPRRHSRTGVAVTAAVGILALAAAAEAAPAALGALALGLAVATVGWRLGRGGEGGAAALAAAATMAPAAAGLALLGPFRSLDLGGALVGSADALVVRAALLAAGFGALAAAARPRGGRFVERALWLALPAALAGAAAADRPAVALPLVVAAGLLGALWATPRRLAAPLSLAALALIAALVGAAGWTLGERLRLRGEAERRVALLLPPEPEAVARVAREAGRALEGLAEIAASDEWRSEEGDLAFALWRRSPLARVDLLSAVVVERAGAVASSFSYGLPLDDRSALDLAPARWVDLAPEAWRSRRVESRVELPGPTTVTFWVVPRPGFGAAPEPVAELAAGLLRGGPGARRGAVAVTEPLLWVGYGADGEIVASPWKQGTPSRARLEQLRGRSAPRVQTPVGPARFAFATGPEGAAALLVAPLALPAALERAGMTAAGGLAALAALALLGAIVALPRPAARDLARRAVRSYSNRLVLVFTLLMLVPLVLLYTALSETLGQRVQRQQAAAAEAALVSAQRVLGEYVLSLEPGFGLGTAIDDALLVWLSRVVQHEVNLYWGSEVYASSKRDLFTAGLLPRRIPGEIWERIALGGESLAARTGRAGGAEYLELYAPLEVPGAPRGSTHLFLAMPLLAQQEEALAETGRIRRRALLATLALFLVLAATGNRLAASFTRPIEEFVAGTRRIAAGAARLDFRPNELELEALGEAIDRMAASIAEGRERLLGEKLLVERIVENVTAGVICLDRQGRVLIANRVARELLAAVPGEPLADRLAAVPGLAPVAAFVAARGERGGHAAVRLPAEGGEREWTLVWAPLAGPGEPEALLVVEDVTEIARGQRLEAWASMARIIAHEIKNPLTPIRLSAEHLREAWGRDRDHFATVFDRCTDNILKQVEELRGIASEFSTYSHVPRLERRPGDLVAMAREVVEAYRAAPPPGLEIRFAAPAEPLPATFDAKLLPRALRNLVENAIRASGGQGEVEVRLAGDGGRATLAVADRGPGVPAEQLERIFEPYFSLHAGGTGLGLPIARRIAEEHGGTLVAHNRASGGLEAVITIPLG